MLIAIGLKSRIARLLKDFENMKPVVILLDIKSVLIACKPYKTVVYQC